MRLARNNSAKAYKGKIEAVLSFVSGVTEIDFMVFEKEPDVGTRREL